MNEITKVKCAFIDKEQLEQWLHDMLLEGWELRQFQFALLGSIMNFHFREGKKKDVQVCIYDVKYDDDEEIFLLAGWKELSRYGLTVIFYHEDKKEPLPLLDMKLYTVRRFMKIFLNFSYIIALLFCVGIEQQSQRCITIMLCTFFLLTLPLLLDIKSTKKRSNSSKLMLNILLAIIASAGVTMIIEFITQAFSVLF